MPIKATFYTVDKRENSTKQPSGSQLTTNVLLKDETSIINPTLLIEGNVSLNSSIITKNYVALDEPINRKYFIEDIVSDHNNWRIYCKADVLGTWKTAILAQEHYVLRSSSISNKKVIDTLYPALAESTQEINHGIFNVNDHIKHSPFAKWGDDFCYVLNINGFNSDNPHTNFGSAIFYVMTPTQMMNFLNYLMSDVSNWSDISTDLYDEGVQRALLNPMQYINSAMLFPFPASVLPGTDTGVIRFGTYKYTGSSTVAKVLNASVGGTVYEQTGFVTIPKHPRQEFGVFLNGSPYSEYILHIGPGGDIPLDSSVFVSSSKVQLDVSCKFDLVTGLCRVVAGVDSDDDLIEPLVDTCVMGGANVPIAQAFTNPMGNAVAQAKASNGVIQAGASAIGSALSGNIAGAVGGLAGIASATVSGIGDICQAKFPTVSGSGSSGSLLSVYDDDYGFYLKSKFYEPVQFNQPEYGRPYMQRVVLNTLTGFCLCGDAAFTGNALHKEKEMIDSYLNNGFFIE